VWLARPSPYGSFIRTSTPVYPGALLTVPTWEVTAFYRGLRASLVAGI
jgi:hypothetical protein